MLGKGTKRNKKTSKPEESKEKKDNCTQIQTETSPSELWMCELPRCGWIPTTINQQKRIKFIVFLFETEVFLTDGNENFVGFKTQSERQRINWWFHSWRIVVGILVALRHSFTHQSSSSAEKSRKNSTRGDNYRKALAWFPQVRFGLKDLEGRGEVND